MLPNVHIPRARVRICLGRLGVALGWLGHALVFFLLLYSFDLEPHVPKAPFLLINHARKSPFLATQVCVGLVTDLYIVFKCKAISSGGFSLCIFDISKFPKALVLLLPSRITPENLSFSLHRSVLVW